MSDEDKLLVAWCEKQGIIVVSDDGNVWYLRKHPGVQVGVFWRMSGPVDKFLGWYIEGHQYVGHMKRLYMRKSLVRGAEVTMRVAVRGWMLGL